MRALEKSPDDRFQSMEELARALSRWAPASGRRSRMRVAVVGGAALAAACAAAVLLDVPSALGLGGNAAPAASSVALAVTSSASSRNVPVAVPKRRTPSAHGSQTLQVGAHSPPTVRSTRTP
jgi:hypothetical protein